MPAPAEGEFYHADLIGLAAVDPQGQRIGEIVAVQNYGAGDLLEKPRLNPGQGVEESGAPGAPSSIPCCCHQGRTRCGLYVNVSTAATATSFARSVDTAFWC